MYIKFNLICTITFKSDAIPVSGSGTVAEERRSFACCAPLIFHSRPLMIRCPVPGSDETCANLKIMK